MTKLYNFRVLNTFRFIVQLVSNSNLQNLVSQKGCQKLKIQTKLTSQLDSEPSGLHRLQLPPPPSHLHPPGLHVGLPLPLLLPAKTPRPEAPDKNQARNRQEDPSPLSLHQMPQHQVLPQKEEVRHRS